jgi:hypothetical protein
MLIDSKFTREALVNILMKLEEERDLNQRVRAKEKLKEKDLPMSEYRTAGEWLNAQSIELVREALINNELKDW